MRKRPEPIPYPAAPFHLSARSAALWHELGPTKADTVGRRVLFQAALEALDRADQARAVISAEGLVTTTRASGAVHIHPLVKCELDSRRQFASIWASLGLGETSASGFGALLGS
jgi:phage terminase small subunit